MNLEDGIVYARIFLKNVLHRNPTGIFSIIWGKVYAQEAPRFI